MNLFYCNVKITAIFFCLIFSLNGFSKKQIYPIGIVAVMSDLIVVGQIKSISPDTYEFAISETIKGSSKKIINVVKFEEWTCDMRFGPYKKGQQLLLLLKQKGNDFEIINGSTGEIPIKSNFITLNYESFDENRFKPYRMTLKDCINGLKLVSQCFQIVGDFNVKWEYPKCIKICNDKYLPQTKIDSKFSAWLLNRMKKYSSIS